MGVDLDKLDAAFAANNRDWWFNAEPINDAYPALAAELRALRALVAELIDDEDCCYDHNGYCQAHSLQAKPCPHERAKALLNQPATKGG